MRSRGIVLLISCVVLPVAGCQALCLGHRTTDCPEATCSGGSAGPSLCPPAGPGEACPPKCQEVIHRVVIEQACPKPAAPLVPPPAAAAPQLPPPVVPPLTAPPPLGYFQPAPPQYLMAAPAQPQYVQVQAAAPVVNPPSLGLRLSWFRLPVPVVTPTIIPGDPVGAAPQMMVMQQQPQYMMPPQAFAAPPACAAAAGPAAADLAAFGRQLQELRDAMERRNAGTAK